MSNEFAFNDRAVFRRLHDASSKFYRLIGGCRPAQFNGVLGSYGARRRVGAKFVHKVPRARPVAVAVEQSADDAAAQHSVKRFVLLAWLPFRDHLLAVWKAANV